MASEIRVNKIINRSGLSTVTFSDTGAIVSGIVTATSFSGNLPAAQLTGTLPAISGANLTSLPSQVTIANNADNRLITGGSGVNLSGEANLTFSSNQLTVHTAKLKGNQLLFEPSGTAYIDHSTVGQDIQVRVSTSSSNDTNGPTFKSNGNLAFASGKGIDFSATADGFGTSSEYEILDDYEEGNFTPYLGGVTNYSSYNVTGTGHYVKIGKVVHINVSFGNIDLNNSSAGRVMIYSLPFAPFIVSGTDCRGVSSNYMSHKVNHDSNGLLHSWYIETTYGSFQGQITKNGTNWTSWDSSNFTQTGVYLDFSGTYFTTA